jgi:YD repeat-containing protein
VQVQSISDDAGVQKVLTDIFGYDELGNRITVTNALGNAVATEYDALGRVIQTKTAEGAVTNVDYAYDANILNINGSKGGIKRTETDVLGKTIIDEQDYYGRNVKHTDKGGHVSSYIFNAGGWLTKQSNTQGQNIDYTYYNNGSIKEIRDVALTSSRLIAMTIMATASKNVTKSSMPKLVNHESSKMR